MFDIGWSELLVIAVVALIAIGPKELPGVLRMVGQWMGKARRMAAEFQGQFNEAMREAEMADLKKSFDEVREAASSFSPTDLVTSLQRDVDKSLDIEGVDKPVESPAVNESAPVEIAAQPSEASAIEATALESVTTPTTPEPPRAETFVEAEAHQAAQEPLAVVREVQPEAPSQSTVVEPILVPSETAVVEPVTSEAAVVPTTPEPRRAENVVEAEAHQAAHEPLAIVREAQPAAPSQHETTEAAAERLKDAKAS